MKQEEGYIVDDITNERYQVDILNLKNTKKVLDKYGDSEFFKTALTDPISKQWFEREPLKIAHIRPAQQGKTKDREFLLVEKTKINNSKADEAIDREINKFRGEQNKW